MPTPKIMTFLPMLPTGNENSDGESRGQSRVMANLNGQSRDHVPNS